MRIEITGNYGAIKVGEITIIEKQPIMLAIDIINDDAKWTKGRLEELAKLDCVIKNIKRASHNSGIQFDAAEILIKSFKKTHITNTRTIVIDSLPSLESLARFIKNPVPLTVNSDLIFRNRDDSMKTPLLSNPEQQTSAPAAGCMQRLKSLMC